MKKILSILLLSLAFTLPVLAEQESVMNVSSVYEREIAPDAVKISFSVTDSGLNIKDIKAKNDNTISNVLALIKKELGQNETVKTTAYSINPVYSYKERVKVFQRYEITNGFEVKLKDLTKISSIIKLATDNGIKNVGNIQFYIEDKNAVSNEAIVEAIKLAKARANVMSNALGSQTLKVKSINVSSSLDNSYSSRRTLSYSSSVAMNSVDSVSEPETIEAGTIKVTAHASIDYYLK